MDPYIELAKKAIETFIKEGRVLEVPPYLPKEMLEKKAGVFVSLHKRSTGELRGCIGTFIPCFKNIAGEIINNAISSATKDPRFLPLKPEELEDLEIKVDVLSEPEPAKMEDLDPKKYGVIIKSKDGKTGLLLPDIPGVEKVEEQIQICKDKAWISPDEPIEIFRFTVERHEEK